MAKEKAYWDNKGNRRYVLDPDDVEGLEREAGVHEYVNKHPREDAEDAAYGDYTKKHHTEAAAHHLSYMKAAQANGNYSDAKRHKILYDMHVKALGIEDNGDVPNEVMQYMQNPDSPRPIKFKPHKADSFFLDGKDDSEDKTVTKSELAKKLIDMAKRVVARQTEKGEGGPPANMCMSENLGDHAWAELAKSLAKARAVGPEEPSPEVRKIPDEDVRDKAAGPTKYSAVALPGEKSRKKVGRINIPHVAPYSHDAKWGGYGEHEYTEKGEKKPYMGRDEGIRRSKLPPGAPGASKDGVGVQVDKKKEASKKAARGKVKEE